MKMQILLTSLVTPIAALVAFSQASASPTRSFSVEIRGERADSPSKARLSYLSACARARTEYTATALGPFVKTLNCTSPDVQDRTTTFRAIGTIDIELKRTLDVSQSPLATGYTDSPEEAMTLWRMLCTDWKSTLQSPRLRTRILFESCGTAEMDRFYARPEVTSSTLRVIKTRLADDRGELCQCRSRRVVFYQDTPFGPVQRVRFDWDLMALVDAGYYERQATYASREECEDEVVRLPLCTE